ncbi:MAG TPA: polysaccharide biosynthesis tyrosine autokinase [Patescibacteria group bacterium]|nr:polysaccharide biosynthesis tyrosine autokinase [Patescibacteria group bacterium]
MAPFEPHDDNQATGTLDLAGFGRLLVRRRLMIIATMVLLTAVAWITIDSLGPRYSAEALLLVGDHQPTLLDIQAAVQGNDTETTESEIQILRSRRIAKTVVETLRLDKDARINTALRPETWSARLLRRTGAAMAPIVELLPTSTPDPEKGAVGADEELGRSRAVDAVMEHLTVTAKGRSRAVGVAFESPDAKLAAAVANTVADSYIAGQLEAKVQASAQANRWLTDRLGELRAQVVETDRAVQQRKTDAGISEGRVVGLKTEQISTLSEQLMQAQSDRMRAESRLRQVQQGGSSDAVGEVMVSPVIQRLREDRIDLLRKLSNAQQTFGDNNQMLVKLRAELAALNSALDNETARVVGSLRAEADAARSREAALRQGLAGLQEQAAKIGAASVDIQAQQHEAEATRALFDRVLARARETNVESGLQKADAEIIAHADVPQKPAFPNKPLLFLISLAAAAVAAGLLVFAVESLDQGIRDLDQVERLLGFPALGFVPGLRKRMARGVAAAYAIDKPLSPFAEAIRSIHTSLMLSDVDHTPKRILITSSLPGEGKTTVSVSLARLMAEAGKRVLLIDCDLRRRSLSNLMKLSNEPGLIDHLLGDFSVADVVVRDPLSAAFVLPAGAHAPNPPDVLGSDNMRRLLAALSLSYDLIILDSAPVLAVSDTRSLCRLVDKVVVAVRWRHTRITAVMPAIRQIVSAGGDIAGVLLTMADMANLKSYTANTYYIDQLRRYFPQ